MSSFPENDRNPSAGPSAPDFGWAARPKASATDERQPPGQRRYPGIAGTSAGQARPARPAYPAGQRRHPGQRRRRSTSRLSALTIVMLATIAVLSGAILYNHLAPRILIRADTSATDQAPAGDQAQNAGAGDRFDESGDSTLPERGQNPAGNARQPDGSGNSDTNENKPAAMPTTTPTATPKSTPKPMATPKPTTTPKPTPKPTAAPTPDANGVVWYNGYADPRTIRPQTVANPDSLTVLVNKYRQLPDGYVPPLADAPNSASQRLHPVAVEAWNALHKACLEETGISLYLVSGYRSQATQNKSFHDAIERKGVAHAVAYYAYPGRSEHQLGLGLDIGTSEKKYISQYFLGTPAGKWMTANGHRYGFILRYPSGKSALTGYGFEAWHFRYVGVATATAIRQKGVVLEQFAG